MAKTALFAKWLQGAMVIADQEQGVGDRWFVDSSSATGGATSGFGASPDAPFSTMAAALSACAAGDTIYVMSQVTEGSLTLSKNNVRIIGIGGPTPTANVWMEAATNTTLLTITGTGCLLKNIRFRVPTGNSTTSIGLALSGATGLVIDTCDFTGRTGSAYAISTDGSSDNVRILNCRFMYLNTATNGTAIYGHTYTDDVIHSGWLIENCIFHSNLKHISARMRQSVIRGCQFAEVGLKPDGTALTATTKINLSGGSNAKWNLVTGNMLPGDYSNTGGYTSGTEDNWVGNYADDVSEAEVGDNGITLAIPAA